jgi:hypothetical protein
MQVDIKPKFVITHIENKLICINRVLDISPFINRHINVVETKAGTP